jgi:hypothetical protein
MSAPLLRAIFASFFALALVACTPATESDSDSGSGDTEDSGGGGGDDAGGGGGGNDAGPGGTPDAGGGGTDAGAPADAGFTLDLDGGLPNIDASVIHYTGVAEDGVICDSATCNGNEFCCLSVGFSGVTGACTADADIGTCTGSLTGPFDCDGTEDCSGTDICCYSGGITQPTGSCVADLTACQNLSGTAICVTNSDCVTGEVCCGTDYALPVDMGLCAAEADCQ